MQILLYDENEMHVYDIVGWNPKPPEMVEYDITRLEDEFTKTAIIPKGTYTAELTTGERKAELDPTTMKRIAKYNLDKDFEEINRKIKSVKRRLEFLNKEMETKEKKLNFMQKTCQKIWDDGCFDEDDDCEGEWE